MVLVGMALWANRVELLDRNQAGSRWTLDLRIDPPATVQKVVMSDGNRSEEGVFFTDLDTAIYFLIDTSVPMKRAFNMGIRPLLSEMARVKPDRQHWIVSYFDTDIHRLYDDATGGELAQALRKVPVRGQRTELWRNTQEALTTLAARPETRKILVLLSDGEAEDTNAYTWNEVVRIANDHGIRIASLDYRDTLGSQNLRKVAEETHGAFWKADKRTQKLPESFYREFTKFVDSEGRVTIPSTLLQPNRMGETTIILTLSHEGQESTLEVKLPVRKLAPPPPPKPKVPVVPKLPAKKVESNASNATAPTVVKPAPPKKRPENNTSQPPKKPVQPAEASKTDASEKGYLLYALIAAGMLLLGTILFLAMRKRKAEPDEEAFEDERTVLPEVEEPETEAAASVATPRKAVAWFETPDGRRYEIFDFPANIGKSSSNDVVIPGQYISRQHATLVFKDGYFYLNDNHSSNGTFVNGRRISRATAIQNGTEVAFGPVKTVFRVAGQGEASTVHLSSTDERTVWKR
jgi:hypothetical protein